MGLAFACISMASRPLDFSVSSYDSLLYYQAARQIAAGQPYVFSPLDDLSTGTTGHLYPFVLVPAFWIGLTGSSVFLYGFLLDGLFYILTVWAWCRIGESVLKTEKARWLLSLLVVCSGHILVTTFGQTDMSLFLAMSSWCLASFLQNRRILFLSLIVLLPLCRPEGMVMACLYFVYVILQKGFHLNVPRIEWISSILGVSSVVLVFMINWVLTGSAQYQSVSLKGYFTQFSLDTACLCFGRDFLQNVSQNFVGLSSSPPRCFHCIPVVGSALALWGFIHMPWKAEPGKCWKLGWWIASALVVVAVLSTSGWQNSNCDRYFAWILPGVYVFLAKGFEQLEKRESVALCAGMCFVLFQIGAMVFGYLPIFSISTKQMGASLVSNREMARAMPSGAKMGVMGGVHFAYSYAEEHPNEPFGCYNLTGIYSPRFLEDPFVLNFETLKHQRNTRFDYWVLDDGFASFGYPSLAEDSALVETFSQGQVRKTNWAELDNALVFPTNGWTLIDSLDVGYKKDEDIHRYGSFCRIPGTTYGPFSVSCTNFNGSAIFEVGRFVAGGESMTVASCPGQPLRILLRTISGIPVECRCATEFSVKSIWVDKNLKLRVFVDGHDLGIMDYTLNNRKNAVDYLHVDIPAACISGTNTNIRIFGDHYSLAYWFLTSAVQNNSQPNFDP